MSDMEMMAVKVKLKELAAVLAASRIVGDDSAALSGAKADHRKVEPGDLFICVPGAVHDGHQYAAEAAAKGAAALVVERALEHVQLPQLIVKNTRQAMGLIASHVYGHPSRTLRLIGITGTNGKTTTAFILDQLLSAQGHMTGLLGTVYTKIGDEIEPAERTTQEAPDLQRTLRRMVDANAAYCTMEVSSHALELGRVKGCRFRTAIFTNLTQDHLDFHHTMDRYRDAKGLLFARLGNEGSDSPDECQYAVLNSDDPASEVYSRITAAQTITYGIEQEADVRAREIRMTSQGTAFTLETFAGSIDIQMKLIGKFNVYNVLAAASAALLEGISLDKVAEVLRTIETVEGRMQSIHENQDFLVLVDYAHTPDGLENALRSISEFAVGRTITVFGCGGDRDRSKRPMMGKIAAEYSDTVIVTSDNPRSEDPMAIIRDVERGFFEMNYPAAQYELIADRKEAIHRAVAMAEPNDVVLIAGKGHETYQILKDRTVDFDDRKEAAEAIRSLKR